MPQCIFFTTLNYNHFDFTDGSYFTELHFKLVMRQREADASGGMLEEEVDMSTAAEEPEILESYLREKTSERQSCESAMKSTVPTALSCLH